jgi:hypothetical protein
MRQEAVSLSEEGKFPAAGHLAVCVDQAGLDVLEGRHAAEVASRRHRRLRPEQSLGDGDYLIPADFLCKRNFDRHVTFASSERLSILTSTDIHKCHFRTYLVDEVLGPLPVPRCQDLSPDVLEYDRARFQVHQEHRLQLRFRPLTSLALSANFSTLLLCDSPSAPDR